MNDIPGGASGKEPALQCRRHKRCEVSSLGPEDSLEKGMTTNPVFLPGEPHGQRSGPQGHIELDTTEAT